MMDGLALSSSELQDVVVVQPGTTLTLSIGSRNPQQHHPGTGRLCRIPEAAGIEHNLGNR